MMKKFSSIFLSGRYSVIILVALTMTLSSVITIVFHSSELIGDEGRYLEFANNLNKGYYSPSGPARTLRNGPGYPLLIYPFTLLLGNGRYAVILNPIMYTLSVYILYKLLLLFSPPKQALITSYLFLLYWPIWISLPFLLTEIYSIFLVIVISFFITTGLTKLNPKYMIVGGLFYSALILTKPIFVYVLYGLLLLCVVIHIFNRKFHAKNYIYIFIISAIILSHSYLIYTYSISGKPFYWLNQSTTLWSMTALEEDELGSNIGHTFRQSNYPRIYETIEGMDQLQQDSVYKHIAILNIKSNPKKYIHNWLCNLSRYMINTPYSHTQQKLTTLFYIVPNSILILLFFGALWRQFHSSKSTPSYIYLFISIIFIYSFGSTLVSASTRRLLPVVPLMYSVILYNKNKYFS